MKDLHKKAIEEYQCPGCVCGSNTDCYEKIDREQVTDEKKNKTGRASEFYWIGVLFWFLIGCLCNL